MAELTETNLVQQQFERAMELPNDRRLYCNGFTIAIAAPDIAIILLYNNQPIAIVNTSHVTAKSFGVTLAKLLTVFEEQTKQDILTIDEINAAREEKNDQ